MKSTYNHGHQISEYTQIIPAEAMTGDNEHDYALYCAILTAGKFMTIKELTKVADAISPATGKQVAESCRRITNENLGYIELAYGC